MSWLDKAEQQLSTHSLAIRAIAQLVPIIKTALDKFDADDAFKVLRFVDRVFDRITEGFDGKVTLAEAEKEIRAYIEALDKQDAAIDARIDNELEKP